MLNYFAISRLSFTYYIQKFDQFNDQLFVIFDLTDQMHLFQNKKKDVKQFLQEMKANKTNRSSNKQSLNSLQRKPSRPTSQEKQYYDQEYYSNGIAHKVNTQASGIKNSRTLSSTSSSKPPHVSLNSAYQPSIKDFSQRNIQQHFDQYNSHNSFYQPNMMAQPFSMTLPLNQNQLDQHFFSNNMPNLNYYPMNFHSPNTNSIYKNNNFPSQNHYSQSNSISYKNRNYNLNEIRPDCRINQHSRSFSQDSDEKIQQTPDFYQSRGFQRPIQYTTTNATIPNVSKLNRPQIAKSNNQKDSHINKLSQSINQNNCYKPNKQHNSQLLLCNNMNPQIVNSRLFNSQTSSIDFLHMEEIRQVQQGLSTQKDSPAKLADIDSKAKEKQYYFEEVQVPAKSIVKSNMFQYKKTVNVQNTLIKKGNPLKKSIIQTLYEDLQIQKQQLLQRKQKKKPQVNSQEGSHQQLFKTNYINSQKPKCSQKQAKRLLTTINKTQRIKIRLNDILGEVTIMMQNVKRSLQQTTYNTINQQGRYYKYLNNIKDNANSNKKKVIRNQMMEIEGEDEQTNEEKIQLNNNRTVQKTAKMIQQNNGMKYRINVQQTIKRNKFYESQQDQQIRIDFIVVQFDKKV